MANYYDLYWLRLVPFGVTKLADPALGFPGQVEKVEQLKKELPNVHVLDQFSNPANPEAHIRWTGTVSK